MPQDYGIQTPLPHVSDDEQPPVRYVVLIQSAATDRRLARLFLDNREQVAEFDATAPEVQMMTDGLAPHREATQPEWEQALLGHSPEERAEAEVYTLEI